MSNIVEEILKNEIEVLKSKYLPEDTGHLRTAVSVLEERLKELPVSDQAYLTAHNIQLEMMKSFDERLDGYARNEVWNRQWAIEKSIEWSKHINELVAPPDSKVSGKIMTSNDVITIADSFLDYVNKK